MLIPLHFSLCLTGFTNFKMLMFLYYNNLCQVKTTLDINKLLNHTATGCNQIKPPQNYKYQSSDEIHTSYQ